VNGAKSIDGERGYWSEEEELRFAPPGYVSCYYFAGTMLILSDQHIPD
jgi:hypothetical protein